MLLPVGQADYFGPTVNLAARVESKAMGGQVLISRSVLDQLDQELKSELVIRPAGGFTFKGISMTQELFAVCLPVCLTDWSWVEINLPMHTKTGST